MRLPLVPEFQAERVRYGLRCACEDCVYFDAPGERCSHEYPTAVHRRRAFDAADAMFCKEFELA